MSPGTTFLDCPKNDVDPKIMKNREKTRLDLREKFDLGEKNEPRNDVWGPFIDFTEKKEGLFLAEKHYT